MPLHIHPGMSLHAFLSQEVSDEEWDEIDPPPVAPAQSFIGPRAYPPKFLRCQQCQEWVQIPDKFRQAKRATCLHCANG